jgi:hypothetical protein
VWLCGLCLSARVFGEVAIIVSPVFLCTGIGPNSDGNKAKEMKILPGCKTHQWVTWKEEKEASDHGELLIQEFLYYEKVLVINV